jgi:trehalose 6-phosphate synthase/phosphatase
MVMYPAQTGRVVIVANRLPATVRLHGGTVRLSPSSGGLATGLSAVHAKRSGIWIGWPGIVAETARPVQSEIDLRLRQGRARGVAVAEFEVSAFYRRFANAVLWPLLHEMAGRLSVSDADWRMYRTINERFADAVLQEAHLGDKVWIHDYHLMLLPRLLRRQRPDLSVGYFLHTPFPCIPTLAGLPYAAELIDGVLGADAVGFHTQTYVQRFAAAARTLLGRRVAIAAGTGVADDAGRPVALHATPMSIDVAAFARRAEHPLTRQRVTMLRAGGTPLFVGVDRLDPTKGIPERLEAFGELLESCPELRGRARLLQLSVPSREDVPAYRALRVRVEGIATDLNARYGTPDWQPVTHVYGAVDPTELTALYRAADVMLVTPHCDGMNLVAKEFVASRTDLAGVLVLSRSAGAAAELTAALLVDPPAEGTLAQAYSAALAMSPVEQRVRMRRLRTSVAAHDVHRWADQCLHHLDAAVQMTG